MSAINNSLALRQNSGAYNDKNIQKFNVPTFKCLDIDSTGRNRSQYPNPCDFVIRLQYPGRNNGGNTVVDPVILSLPTTGGTGTVGSFSTQTSASATSITLSANDSNIENFYNTPSGSNPGVNPWILQLGNPYNSSNVGIISTYDSVTKIATLQSPIPSGTPAPGTTYYTRQGSPILVTTVSNATTPTNTRFSLGTNAPSINGIYVGSYINFTSGANINQVIYITGYTGSGAVVTLASPLPKIPSVGDNVEIVTLSYDNATTLITSKSINSITQSSYWEIDLLWISIPNVYFSSSYGGSMDCYPCFYVEIYNEGNQLSQQVFYSNNQNSNKSVFKVPVNNYFGDSFFNTFKDSKAKQIVQLKMDSDIRFTLRNMDGSILQFATPDAMSPYQPNPLFQVNASIALRNVVNGTN